MTEWKPTEQNIGQPVLDTYPASVQNNTYIPPVGTLHIGSKWYDVDTTKLTSIKDVEALFDAIGLKVSETNENFDKVKYLLIIPEKPKTLDEIQQEFEEKIDALIKTTKEKFECSNYFAGKRYNEKFDRIIQDFEYAKEHGSFPKIQTLTLDSSKFVAIGSSLEPSFVIKQGNKHEGYYTNGNRRYLKYYMPTKPNVIVRFFMKTCLGFVWIDEKDT